MPLLRKSFLNQQEGRFRRTERRYEVALLEPSGAELLGASTAAKLEDQIVVLGADVDLAASLWVSISSACGSSA